MKTAQSTISDLFGGDKIQEAMNTARKYPHYNKFGVGAEIILGNGTRRYFRSKSWDRNTALREVLTFVEAVEQLTGETVMWKLRGENTYYMSTNYTGHLNMRQKASLIFKKAMSYLFDL